jgi:hypothetical protein
MNDDTDAQGYNMNIHGVIILNVYLLYTPGKLGFMDKHLMV